jgi:hypothetical protein
MHRSCEEGQKLGDVYREVKRKVGTQVSVGLAASLLSQNSFSSKVSRKKAKKWPKIPAEADLLDEETIPECIKTFQIMADTINGPVSEIQIFESWIHSGKTQTMMVFGTDDMIKSMAAAGMCFVDGTFDTCPSFCRNFFMQLLCWWQPFGSRIDSVVNP